jgi:hypothetical protein
MGIHRFITLSAVLLAVSVSSTYASPCSREMTRRCRPACAELAAGWSLPQSVGAMMHRQPTPGSVAAAEACEHGAVQKRWIADSAARGAETTVALRLRRSRDLLRLQRLLLSKKPPAPSVKERPSRKPRGQHSRSLAPFMRRPTTTRKESDRGSDWPQRAPHPESTPGARVARRR